MLRHVSNSYYDNWWIATYKSIRTFYPDTHIKIIDNNSTCASVIPLENCEIVQAKYPKTGLYSPYYEFLHINEYSKAVIIHDGFIFNKYVDFSNIRNVKFLWHFEDHNWDDNDAIMSLFNVLENNEQLINLYVSRAWNGCMGCISVIDKSFLNILEEKYKISNIAPIITERNRVWAFERVLAVLCYNEYTDLKHSPSIEGDIRNLIWGYTYNDYINNPSAQIHKPFFKLFGDRR
jgi:hypothetical protein